MPDLADCAHFAFYGYLFGTFTGAAAGWILGKLHG